MYVKRVVLTRDLARGEKMTVYDGSAHFVLDARGSTRKIQSGRRRPIPFAFVVKEGSASASSALPVARVTIRTRIIPFRAPWVIF